MKKIMWSSLVISGLISGLAYASDCDCPKQDEERTSINITVTNATSSLCTLDNYRMTGRFSFYSNLSDYIQPYSSSNPTIILGWGDYPGIELDYSCGADRKISISSKMVCSGWFSCEFTSAVLASKNMTAIYTTNSPGYRTDFVRWRLLSD